jgi:RHH-type transcriptional regulator, rel operon repressor / antitoxin RelB
MLMPEKTKEIVSVSLDRAHRKELDKRAARLERDRSYLVNEAVGSYLARLRWEEEHIKEGLRQARAGEFATDEEVEAAYAAFGSPRKA